MPHHTDMAEEGVTIKYITARVDQKNLIKKRTELI